MDNYTNDTTQLQTGYDAI